MIVVYSPQYHIDLGMHVFPTGKYSLLYDRIRASAASAEFIEPAPATWEQLALAHTSEYLHKLQTGDFDFSETAQLEVPWSRGIVEGFRRMTGGTIEAALRVLGSTRRPAGHGDAEVWPTIFHIGGGFHHAFANHGEGFCLFNDVAVTVRLLLADNLARRVAVIDLDVHQGNGTAFIFEREPHVFTFSMHQENNYPAFKPTGSLDIGLPDRATDAMYLEYLDGGLERVIAFDPQMAFYLAGADPYHDDQLGGLALSKAGLRERDRVVLDACAGHHIPVVVLLAGGYARRIEDTVDIHLATFEEADRRSKAGLKARLYR